MEFKDKILRLRADLNITQMELAKELNVAFSTINRWENGKIVPSKKTQLVIEKYCKSKDILWGDNHV